MRVRDKKVTAGLLGITAALLLAGVVCVTDSVIKKQKVIYDYESNRTENCTSRLFGENTYVFSPQDSPEKVNEILEDLWSKQESNQFGKERYAIYFMPGEYDESIAVKVGFYMQAAGLGELPTDTKIASLNCDARWLGDDPANHNACCNFWRGVENLEIGSNTVWAVSQATFMRRVSIEGALYLHDDYGWCSGGFLADSDITLMIDSGSQQQWLSRNNKFKTWMGENWNMVFAGDEPGCDPVGTWPAKAYTAVEKTPVIREKPFLIYDEEEGFMVFVPKLRKEAAGISWEQGAEGEKIPLSEFYIARPEKDTAQTLNEALQRGKHLLFTPGIYRLEEALSIEKENTIVLGMGLATLEPLNGNACIETADADGIFIAGLLFDAGERISDNLLVVGDKENSGDHTDNPICLSDVFFRVGGAEAAYPAQAKICATINSSQVIGDNFWVWRADHGNQVAWDANIADTGIVVNGDDVSMYALMVEHFQKYQTVWNGSNGMVIMYQSEMPYDVPSQEEWMSHDGTCNGYASFYVDEAAEQFEGYGLGIYSYHRDAVVDAECAMELPDKEGVKVHHICAIMITGNPGIRHVINEAGDAADYPGARSIIIEYENGIQK
ncbi:MAG: sialidase [Lachnospiraceae bacterium]|nr:sialidase [Lachnospiraceae bacterium]